MITIHRALALVLCVGLAHAQTVDENINLGDKFNGSISTTSDIDVLAFDGLIGESLSVTVGPAKKSELIPVVALFAVVDGAAPVLLTAQLPAKGKKAVIKNYELPSTGSYLLAFSGDVNTSGGFSVKTKSKLAKSLVKPPSAPVPGPGPEKVRVKIPVRPGSELTAVIGPGKKSLAVPGTPTLRDPDNKLVDISAFMATKGAKTTLKKIPLDVFGVYTLDVVNVGESGEIVIKAKVKKPKIKKRSLTEYEFGGELVITPDVLYVNAATEIVATIALGDENTDPTDVSLVKFVNGVETDVSPLFDDGILGGNGDEIEADNIFTARIATTPSASEKGVVEYAARVGRLGKLDDVRSAPSTVLIADHLTNGEINDAINTQKTQQAKIDQAVQNGNLANVLASVKNQLQNDPDVAQVGFSNDGLGLWVVYESGIPAVLYAWENDVKGGVSDAELGRSVLDPHYDAFTPETTPLSPHPIADALAAWRATQPTTTHAMSVTKNVVGSNKVRAIAAQHWDWGDDDDIPAMAQTLIDDKCFDVTYTKYAAEGTGTVEDFKDLSDYGLVLISSHGDSFFQDLDDILGTIFSYEGPNGQVIVHSNMAITAGNIDTYEDDILKGRIVLWGDQYGMAPSFFRKYSGKMPNSIVYTSICRGAYNGTLANAFIGKGAAAFLSYTDYVAVAFCEDNGPPLLDKLLEPEKTLDDAFVAGIKENDKDPAEFKLFGDKTVALDPREVKNGGFEDGTAGWTKNGDARSVPSLAGYNPTSGKLLGVISTGLGFTTASGSFSQTVCLPEDVSFLAFDWIFFSEEFLEFCGSVFQDTFEVRMTDLEGGGSSQLFITFVDDLCGPPGPNGTYNNSDVKPVSASFDQGDVYTTGWKVAVVSVPISMVGKKVKIEFSASDVGDSIYDTAIGLDRIELIK